MGFVRTPGELAAIARALGRPRFVGRQLKVEFLTRADTLARLLPPPLQAPEQPLVAVSVGSWRSNAFGDFAGASVYLAARHAGQAGAYALAMWMDREAPMVFGREVFGEPKKLANISIARDGERHHASVERGGSELIALSAVMERDVQPDGGARVAFHFRSRTAVDGAGLDGPAVLTRATFAETVALRREGPGSIELSGTAHDPLDELEIVSVLGASYSEQEMTGRCEAVASVAGEDFLPYHHGRADDWLVLDTATARAPATASETARVG